MPLSKIIRLNCKVCNKIAVEKKRSLFGKKILVTLECGHFITESSIAKTDYNILSSDGKSLMNYQTEGVKFAEEANGRCLIADEQGLGKTVQALGLFFFHREELLPAVIVTKTTVKSQWFYEVIRWMGHPKSGGPVCQIINSGRERPIREFDIYITTYDMLKVDGMFDGIDIKTLVVDECQAIKNHLSERAKAVQGIAKQCEHIIGLSGTPIKNNAGEYFTILNILQPRRFPSYQGYIDTYCDSYSSGWGTKVGGLKNPEYFHERTKDFIIRRTKAEVLPDLPSLTRKFYHVELDKKLNKAYAAALQELDDLFYNEEVDASERGSITLAIMSKMRYITGISKCEECTDFVTEFLLSCDRKITVFVHHQDASALLNEKLSVWCDEGAFARPLVLHSGLTGEQRAALVKQFQEDDSKRIMIASTLAAGEGLNLQFCSDAIMLERQWNPPNEEQAEGRFHRFGQINPVSVTYMLASGTIDEYFTELVEQKRAIVASTLDNKTIAWDQSSLLKELTEILVTTGRKRWTL